MEAKLPCSSLPPRPRLWFSTGPPRPYPLPVQPPPPKLPTLPLRIKVSYDKEVTVCIAAIARAKAGRCIVVCCDSRLDQGWLGSTVYNQKLRIVGTGWLSMISGRWQPAQELVKAITNRFKSGAVTLSDALATAREAANDYHTSAFFSNQEEALVSGFVGSDPIVMHIGADMSVEALPHSARECPVDRRK